VNTYILTKQNINEQKMSSSKSLIQKLTAHTFGLQQELIKSHIIASGASCSTKMKQRSQTQRTLLVASILESHPAFNSDLSRIG
jgi:hypothetical protein